MTAAEITERQVARVRELTNLSEEELPTEHILERLRDNYPSDAADIIMAERRAYPRDYVARLRM